MTAAERDPCLWPGVTARLSPVRREGVLGPAEMEREEAAEVTRAVPPLVRGVGTANPDRQESWTGPLTSCITGWLVRHGILDICLRSELSHMVRQCCQAKNFLFPVIFSYLSPGPGRETPLLSLDPG